jgi:hypothetical protein
MQSLLPAIYRRHRVAVDQVDLLLGVKLGRPQPQIISAGLTSEVRFRQWRALVRQGRLVANQHDAAGKAGVAQRGSSLETGLAGADDGDDRSRHQTCVSGR